MDSRTHPLFLGTNQYAMGRNLEIRDHTARTRRGSWRAWQWPDSLAVQGVGYYRAPYEDQRSETIVTVRNGELWEQHPPLPPFKMTLPTGVTLTTTETPQFIQAYNVLYMIRGDNLPTIKWDGYDNSAWQVITAPVSGDAFPNCRIGLYAYNRGWAVEGSDTLDASDLLSEAFDFAFHSYEIDSGDGGKITALAPFVDGSIMAFKENSVHMLSGCNGDLTDLSREILDDRHGCVGPQAQCAVGKDIWFLSKDGIRTITLTTQNQAQLIDTTLSYNVQGLIDRINWAYSYKAQCVVYDNYFLCAVPWDASTVCNTILVYDLLLKTWVGYWDGITVERFLIGGTDQIELYAIEQYGHVSMLLKSGYRDGVRRENSQILLSQNSDRIIFTGLSIDTTDCSDALINFSIAPRSSWQSATILTIENTASPFGMIYGFLTESLGIYTIEIVGFSGFVLQYRASAVITSEMTSKNKSTFIIGFTGAEIYLLVNGIQKTLTFTVYVSKYSWITSFDKISKITIGDNLALYWSGIISDFCIYRSSATTGAKTFKFMAPLNEGSANGTATKDLVSGTNGTLSRAGMWSDKTAESEIPTEVTTRAFSFGGDETKKALLQGFISVDHQNPTYTVQLIPDTPYRESTIITAKTYSTTLFSTQGKTAWDGTGPRFDEPNRENYAPVSIGAGTPSVSGIALETAGSVSYNVQLDRDQQHREKFFAGIPVQHVQAKITNTTGVLGLNSIGLIADQKPFLSITKG